MVFCWLAVGSLPVWVIDGLIRASNWLDTSYWITLVICPVGAVATLLARGSELRYRVLGAVLLLAAPPFPVSFALGGIAVLAYLVEGFTRNVLGG